MKILGLVVAGILLLVVGFGLYSREIANPRVLRELRSEPDGARARKVMVLTLPSGKVIPVNYLREGDRVFAGADFPWWRELEAEGRRVELLIRGETLTGWARAILDDPEHRAEVFGRLRPTAPRWAGTLVEIDLSDPRLRAGS